MDVRILVNGDCAHCQRAAHAITAMVADFPDVDATCLTVDVARDPSEAERVHLHACPGVVVADCLCFLGVPPPEDLHQALLRSGGPEGALGIMRRYEARDETILPVAP